MMFKKRHVGLISIKLQRLVQENYVPLEVINKLTLNEPAMMLRMASSQETVPMSSQESQEASLSQGSAQVSSQEMTSMSQEFMSHDIPAQSGIHH